MTIFLYILGFTLLGSIMAIVFMFLLDERRADELSDEDYDKIYKLIKEKYDIDVAKEKIDDGRVVGREHRHGYGVRVCLNENINIVAGRTVGTWNEVILCQDEKGEWFIKDEVSYMT